MKNKEKYLSVQNGLEILQRAFPVRESTFIPKPSETDYDWIERAEQARPVSELPLSDRNKLRELEDIGHNLWGELSVEIDTIAWYRQFAVSGPNYWGIYFDTKKMDLFVARTIGSVWQGNSEILSKQIEMVVWDQVFRHEIEHCAQELSVAVGVLDGLSIGLDSPIDYLRSQKIRTEALASYFETVDPAYRTKSGNQSHRRFIETVLSSRPRPGEYDLWNKIDMRFEIRDLERAMNGPLRFSSVSLKQVQSRIRNQDRNHFLKIPIWLV